MKTDLIRQLDTLCKAFLADRYEVDIKVTYPQHLILTLVVRLKDNKDVADVLKALSEARQIEGG